MNVILTLSGTFLMFSGFFSILTGLILYKMKQEDLGRMYMSLTMMGGGEHSQSPMTKFITNLRGNDPLKKNWAYALFCGGLFLALIGAAIC